MMEIVQVLTSFVSEFFQDGEGGTNSVLDFLDEDPSWDMVEQFIGSLSEISNSSRWAIGEILVFLRYRDSHHTVATFDWNMGTEWPDELFRFVKEHYGVALSLEQPTVVEFLAWQSYRYEKFWLLIRPGQIKVWDRGRGVGLDEDVRFDEYLRQLSARLHSVLDGNTLQNYYVTAFGWPRSRRYPDMAWTWHFEEINQAGSEVDSSLRGIERLEAKAPIAWRNAEIDIATGRTTVPRLRQEQRRNTQRRQGFIFELPDIPYLIVIDTETEEKHIAIEFHSQAVARATLYFADLLRDYPPERYDLIWDGNELKLNSGEVVATVPNPDEPVVASALFALSGKMNWKVKR